MNESRYCKNQFVNLADSSACGYFSGVKLFGTKGRTTAGELYEAVKRGKELLAGNTSVSETALAEAYLAYRLYAEQHNSEILIPEEGFILQARADAMWRINRLRQMSGGLPEVALKVNTPEGGVHPMTVYGKTYLSSSSQAPAIDAVITRVEGCMLRLNLADCPSILMAEKVNGKIEAVSAWHFGYMPIHFGLSQSFLDYYSFMAQRSEEVIYITPGIEETEINGARARIFNPPDEAVWNFAQKRADGTITVRLAAYVRDLVKRAKAEHVIDSRVNTVGSPDRYSYRQAGNALKSGKIDADSVVTGFNAYCIAWE